ncbi:MAG: DUF4149 domain-containing protein [Helicobacteraceae bacterium]|jgi:hypothetical protein|nr:DUF4149 domain-containing protein [Helicobacteraceae bacterium]
MQIKIFVESFYIVLLGVMLGSTLTLGAFVAPVVFKAALYMDNEAIGVFDSGRLMSEIFRRYSICVSAALVFSVAYEIWRFWIGDRRLAVALIATIVLISGGLFAWYYVPAIYDLQTQGVDATLSADFGTLHSQSVTLFKIFAAANCVLLAYRVSRLFRG